MDAREFAFNKLLIEIRNGCHADMLCYCAVANKVESWRAALGPDYFRLALMELCLKCDMTPAPQPNTPISTEPVPVDVTPINTTRKTSCDQPSAANFDAYSQELSNGMGPNNAYQGLLGVGETGGQ